jgi:proteasome lid subunit RPN8/RPN11
MVKQSYFSIRASVIHQIRDYSVLQLPLQSYGILAGRAQEITHFFPIISYQNNCLCSFEFEPRTYLEIIKQIRDLRLEWLGMVHSHPHSYAYPSSRDQTEWHFNDKSCWILSLKGSDYQLSAYYIHPDHIVPVIYEIIGTSS